jgi:hypothetical protein
MNERDRKRKLKADLAKFVRQYARKKPRGRSEPNDRGYDRALEQRLRKMRPEDIDGLLRDEEE